MSAGASLSGHSGELMLVRVTVDSRLLEELLECLSGLPFPVNPQFHHELKWTEVEFPAYSGMLAPVHEALERAGLDGDVETVDLLESLHPN